MTLAVIVVNYLSSEEISKRLRSDSFPSGSKIYIVDNYSNDLERGRCLALCADRGWEFLQPNRNLGFGAACNLAAEAAERDDCDAYLLLNPDASISLGDVQQLLQVQLRSPAAIVAPVILNEGDRRPWFQGGKISWRRGMAYHPPTAVATRDLDWLTAACLLVSRDSWQKLCGFNEDFFLYWEDVELTYRWKQFHGGQLIVAHDSVATHAVGGTQGVVDGKSPLYVRFNLINRLRFARVLAPVRVRIWWAVVTPLFVFELWKGVAPAFHGGVRLDYVRALCSGLWGASGQLLRRR